MISKNRIKDIKVLKYKKKRDEKKIFVAEGYKTISELAKTFPCEYLAVTEEVDSNLISQIAPQFVERISPTDLKRISFLKTPHQALALFKKKTNSSSDNLSFYIAEHLSLALDDIQDPGNLGTIIRLADWFGIEHVFCSLSTVDAFSPKTVQATMGALARVQIHYCELEELITQLPSDIPIYGTFLNGTNIYKQPLKQRGLLIMGNEGNGISQKLTPYITQRLYIPNYPEDRITSESLNVAIATAIACAEFRRCANNYNP